MVDLVSTKSRDATGKKTSRPPEAEFVIKCEVLPEGYKDVDHSEAQEVVVVKVDEGRKEPAASNAMHAAKRGEKNRAPKIRGELEYAM